MKIENINLLVIRILIYNYILFKLFSSINFPLTVCADKLTGSK